MMFRNSTMGGGTALVMVLGMLVVLVAAIAVVVVLVRHVADRPTAAAPTGSRTAEDILAGRYARGDIDDEEYGRRLAVLRSAAGRPGSDAAPPGSAR